MKHVYAFSSFTNVKQSRSWLISISLVAILLAVIPAQATVAVPDPVLEWVGIMNDTVLAGGTSPLLSSRVVALVSGSVFDAVNGITPLFSPLHVRPNAPAGASQRAAAVQAAYAMLIKIYPAQISTLTDKRNASIKAIKAVEDAQSVQAGIDWGQRVAYFIWQWRLNDGIAPAPPPFLGVASIVGMPAAVGAWRPTPLANAPGAGPQFATMEPWVLTRPGQFRLPAPLALNSAEYAADLSEVTMMGSFSGSGRSSDQSDFALFWAGNTPLYWNRIALQIATQRSLPLWRNARLFARLNVSMADAAIACWDSKYRYVFWRPITAIRDSSNPNPDPTWTPWLDYFPSGTPAHPEYPSGHSTVSGAAAFLLASVFGDDTAFTVSSDVWPGTRSFTSFSAAVAEIADARVFGGIHFRTSCVRGNLLGRAVAQYVSSHSMQ